MLLRFHVLVQLLPSVRFDGLEKDLIVRNPIGRARRPSAEVLASKFGFVRNRNLGSSPHVDCHVINPNQVVEQWPPGVAGQCRGAKLPNEGDVLDWLKELLVVYSFAVNGGTCARHVLAKREPDDVHKRHQVKSFPKGSPCRSVCSDGKFENGNVVMSWLMVAWPLRPKNRPL